MPRKAKAPSTFISIDASTQSMAYAVIKDGKVLKFGKIEYEGKTLDERLRDISIKSQQFFSKHRHIKTVVIEDTVFINSAQTVTTLSKCQGALLAAAYLSGVEHSYRVSPIAWQAHIGTRLLTPEEKAQLKKQYPGRSASWYKSKERSIRKQKTMDTVNAKFGLKINDDDIADSIGLSIFACENWSKVLSYGRK